jgi:DNA-binding transcriptional LysR family regulator
MKVTELKYFIEVAAVESLSRAAERLGISQPALSISMKRFEQEAGVTLFHRHKTGVKLTVGGQRLLIHAKKLIQLWEEVKYSAYQAEHEIEGQFILGCHASVALYYIPSRLSQFLRDHPRVHLKIVNGLSRQINETIISMKIDIGIVVNPIRHPDLVLIKLRDDEVGFWHHKELVVDEKQVTLLCDPELAQSSALIAGLEDRGIKVARIIEAQSLELLLKLASQRVGIAILPQSVVTSHANHGLKKMLPDLIYHDEIFLVFRHENRFVKTIEAIIAKLRVE